jgi:hypothetical protein
MAAGSTYTKIASNTLGSAAASVTFSSIPSTYTDLVLVSNWSITVGSGASLYARVNSDSGTNYSYTNLVGNGSTATSVRQSSVNVIVLEVAAYAGMANTIANFMNYSNTTTNKTIIHRENNAGSISAAYVNLWRNTSAINALELFTSTSTFVSGSTFNLYGITAA